MNQPHIPTEYFDTYNENEVLLPAVDFCEFLCFRLELDPGDIRQLNVLTKCIERCVLYILTIGHQVNEYADDERYLLDDLVTIAKDIKGAIPNFSLDGTINDVIKELEKIMDFYTINPWGLYTTRCEYPFVYVTYVGDYRIIKWSMSSEGQGRFRSHNIRNKIYEELHNLRRAR